MIKIKLADFIGSQSEDTIINCIHKIATSINHPMLCKFWYKNGQLELPEVNRFVKQHESKLFDIGSKVICVFADSIPERDNWFCLMDKTDVTKTDNFRYRCIYDKNNLTTLIIALFGFKKVVDFLVGAATGRRGL